MQQQWARLANINNPHLHYSPHALPPTHSPIPPPPTSKIPRPLQRDYHKWRTNDTKVLRFVARMTGRLLNHFDGERRWVWVMAMVEARGVGVGLVGLGWTLGSSKGRTKTHTAAQPNTPLQLCPAAKPNTRQVCHLLLFGGRHALGV